MAAYNSLKEIARQLGIPYTSAREYVKRFAPYFPTQKIPGIRWPVYPEDATQRLQIIRDGYQQGLQAHALYNKLAEKYGAIVEVARDENENTNEFNDIDLEQAVQLLSAGRVGSALAMQTVDMYRELLETHRQMIASQGELLAAQQAHVERLKARIADLEAGQGE